MVGAFADQRLPRFCRLRINCGHTLGLFVHYLWPPLLAHVRTLFGLFITSVPASLYFWLQGVAGATLVLREPL